MEKNTETENWYIKMAIVVWFLMEEQMYDIFFS